jgi:hypothetical protein
MQCGGSVMATEKRLIEPCEICEMYIKGERCEHTYCPVAKMKAENNRLKEENRKLRNEMSYMSRPNTIGDRHEMGCW